MKGPFGYQCGYTNRPYVCGPNRRQTSWWRSQPPNGLDLDQRQLSEPSRKSLHPAPHPPVKGGGAEGAGGAARSTRYLVSFSEAESMMTRTRLPTNNGTQTVGKLVLCGSNKLFGMTSYSRRIVTSQLRGLARNPLSHATFHIGWPDTYQP